jgi:hypothetical protein
VPDVDVVWHYNNWHCTPGAVADGYLRPVHTDQAAGAPLLWFTTDQMWDWTSVEDILGSVRFGLGVDDSRLKSLRRCGVIASDPEKWFAVAEAVPLDDLMFEVLHDASGDWAATLTHDGPAWKPADPAAVARAYIADEARARAERDSRA